ncbi:hypothetical protein ROHU_000116 [Labeo rohita]|uniref:Uncharacterized protein n=1 Tax=Labeo rohita TaxID=84645 RepID=A0A498P4A2_LABRO|nr:hypothetical protein ROHU_000116 [Labeo rohita]
MSRIRRKVKQQAAVSASGIGKDGLPASGKGVRKANPPQGSAHSNASGPYLGFTAEMGQPPNFTCPVASGPRNVPGLSGVLAGAHD